MNNTVSLLKAKKIGMFTLLNAVIPAITLPRKVKLRIKQFFAFSKENSGTAQIFGIPFGRIILKTIVKAIPNKN